MFCWSTLSKFTIYESTFSNFKVTKNRLNYDTVISALLDSREEVFKKAETYISKAQKQKKMYEKKHIQSKLPKRLEVLLENTTQKQRKKRKD